MNMKTFALVLLSVMAVSGNEVIPEFKTAKRVYVGVTVTVIEPDGIRISHESGFAKIGFDDLTSEQRITYGLTAEKRGEYAQNLNKARIATAEERAQRLSSARIAPVKTESPRYITSQQIKVYWYSQLPTPRTMDRDFHSATKARARFVADIREGFYNLSADKTAAEYNKQEALAFKDLARAKLCEEELSRIAQQEAEIQRAEDARKARLATQQLTDETARLRMATEQRNSEMSSLRSSLDSLSSDLSRIRSSIWQLGH